MNSTEISTINKDISTSMESVLIKVHNDSTGTFNDIFVISFVEGLLLKNINTGEEVTIITDGVVDSIKVISTEYRDEAVVNNRDSVLVSLYSIGFQNINIIINNNKIEYQKSKVLASNISSNIISTSFCQVNDYLFYTNIAENSKSIVVAKYKLPETVYKNIFSKDTVYNAYDSFKVPLVNTDEFGNQTTEYTYKYTKTAGTGRDLTLYEEELEYEVISETEEVIPSCVITQDNTNQYRFYVLGLKYGILIYDYNTVNDTFSLVSYYKEELFTENYNYNYFIKQDGDYIYYNIGTNLCKLNIDLNNMSRVSREYYDFNEIVNNMLISGSLAEIITSKSLIKINLNYFNDNSSRTISYDMFGSTVSKECDVTAMLNLDDRYVYTELVKNESFLNIIHKNGTKERYKITNYSIISLSYYNNYYYMMTDKRKLLVFDINTKNVIYSSLLDFNYKLENDIIYFGTKKANISFTHRPLDFNYTEKNINFDFNNYTPKALKSDFSKLENKENDVIHLEISELQFKIIFSKDNLTALYNKFTNLLKLIAKNDNVESTKEMLVTNFCFSEDGKLFIFDSNKIKVINFDTIKPNLDMFSQEEIEFEFIEGISNSTDRYCKCKINKIIHYNDIFLIHGTDDSLYVLNTQNEDSFGYYISNLSFIQDFTVFKENFIVSTNNKIIKYNKEMIFEEELDYQEELSFPKLFPINDYVVIQSKNTGDNLNNIDYYNPDYNSIIRTTNNIIYNSGVANIGDRIFFGYNSILEYSLSDVLNTASYNLVDSFSTTCYGINKRLEHVEDDLEVFSLVQNNNTIISYQVPNYDVLYASTNGKIYKPINEFLFGYDNSYYDGYRLLKDIGLRYKLVTNKIISDFDFDLSDYRNKKVISTSSGTLVLTDNNVLLNGTSIINLYTLDILDITANDNYLAINDNKNVLIYNYSGTPVLVKTISLLDSIISIDKNSDNLYMYSKKTLSGYNYDISSDTLSTLSGITDYGVQEAYYNDTILKVQAKRKNIRNNDYIYNEPKNIKELEIAAGVFSYNIEKNLVNVSVYIDDQEMNNFSYNYNTGELIINYLLSGFENIKYSFLSNPVIGDIFYDIHNKDYVNVNISPEDTINGVDVYDIAELNDIQIPDGITKITLERE